MQYAVIRAVFVAINGLIFLSSIILNLLAIVYILSTRDKTTIAMLVVNLAIADIIHASTCAAAAVRTRPPQCLRFVLVGIIFFSSNLFTRSWIFGEFGCKFSLTTDVLCTVVSEESRARLTQGRAQG